jgi:hypothetical protein
VGDGMATTGEEEGVSRDTIVGMSFNSWILFDFKYSSWIKVISSGSGGKKESDNAACSFLISK